MKISSLFVLTSIGCILLMAACGGPKVKNLYCDESFGPSSVRSGDLYVGGVTYAVEEREDREEIWKTLTDQLWTEMAENIKDCHISPNNRLTSILEEPSYKAVMNCYEKSGALDNDVCLWLKESFGGKPALVAFGRIENDEHWNSEEKVKDTTGKHIKTKFCTYRKLKIRMEVFDVIQEKMVWSGYFNHKDKTANEYDEIFGDDNLIEVIVDIIVDEEKDREFPPVPGLVWVADDVFKAFAKSLPEK